MKVKVEGEVLYPGEYVLTTKDERLTSLIERAGGLTRFAYADGARLNRTEDGIGDVLLDLDKALKNKSSKYNYVLRKGDVIKIPAIKDLVSLKGEFNYPADKKPENLYVPYNEGKDAKFYIDKYGAGFSDSAQRRKTYVIRPNGKILGTHRSFFGKNYPKVEKGSTIVIPKKPTKTKKEAKKGTATFYKALNATIATTTSLVTLLVLILTLTKK